MHRAPARLIVRTLLGLAFASLSAAAGAQAVNVTGAFPSQQIDSDGDGVPDFDDNCPDTPGLTYRQARLLKISVDRCGCPLDPCEADSDGDGVDDCNDRCTGTLRGVTVDAEGCPRRVPAQIELDVKFDFARANLRAMHQADIDGLADLLQRFDDLIVVLEGHTDSRGSAQYNLLLSRVRATVIRREVLMRSGVSGERIFAVGYGEAHPVASNSSDAGRQDNRRTVANLVFTGS